MEKNEKNIYQRKEVLAETLKYFNGDELAANVWINKYCLKDSSNNLYEKSPVDMHWRIAKELERIEKKYPNPLVAQEIFETLDHFKRIVPQGSPMAGIGNNYQTTSLGNCFVIGNKADSYGGIFRTDQEQTQLMKRRGGVGHDLSIIRPKDSKVNNSALTSTGVVPFMERYSNSTKEVAQEGRRGALMLSIDIKHPDAEDFIDAKLTEGKVTNANISIKLSNEFMNAVKNESDFIQSFPINLNINYDSGIRIEDMEYNVLYKGALGLYKKINAKKIWDKIIHNAWKSAEPGILFWDNVLTESIPSNYGEDWVESSTNPCGELPLPPNDSCRLLAINLFGYVVNPFTEHAEFNYSLFKKDTQIAMRYMDDIVDLELERIDKIIEKIQNDPENTDIKETELKLWKKIKQKTFEGRRTGLGITGEGDMLAALGLTYGTDEANIFVEKIHMYLKHFAYLSSAILAKERGAFPIYDAKLEKNNPFLRRIKEDNKLLYDTYLKKYGRRNIALLTIAPTGSVSILTQTTSGIEPVFLPFYTRRRKINPNDKDVRVDFIDKEGVSWMEYPIFHHNFETWLKVNGFDIDIVKGMTKEQVNEIIKKSPYYKATSADVDWVKKVEMQGLIQKHVDHSISVTVNLPETVTEEIVSKVYMAGFDSNCKGITVYRDKSRDGVLITDDTKKEKAKEELFEDHHAPKRPKRLKGEIHRFQNNLEKWIAVVGINNDRPYEIFTGKLTEDTIKIPTNIKECEVVKKIVVDKDGVRSKRYDLEYEDSNGETLVYEGLNKTFNPEFWNYAKLISGILRHGMPIVYAIQLIDSLTFKEDHINTWKNGVVRTLKKYIQDGIKGNGTCPSCGSTHLEYKEGCLTCMSCGNSKCS